MVTYTKMKAILKRKDGEEDEMLEVDNGIHDSINLDNSFLYDTVIVPHGIQTFSCRYSEIENLILPKTVETLSIVGSKIKELDILDSLDVLVCSKGVKLSRIDIDKIVMI